MRIARRRGRPRGTSDKHFYQLLCIHRLLRCHNSVYTIDISALSGNERFDTRTLIKSTRHCVNISLGSRGRIARSVIASRRSAVDAAAVFDVSAILCTHVTWNLHEPLFTLCTNIGSPVCIHCLCIKLRRCLYWWTNVTTLPRYWIEPYKFVPTNNHTTPVSTENQLLQAGQHF